MTAQTTLTLANRLEELERLAQAIEEFGAAHALSAKVVYAINLSLDELVTNIISYGFPGGGEHRIEVVLQVADGMARITLSDDGIAFNPLQMPKPDATAALEERRIGGWGIQFVREMMDELQYAREHDRNVLRLAKKIESPDGDGRQ